MKKLLYLLIVGAVSLAACGGGSGAVAATVNGEDVTVGQVEALMDTGDNTVSKDDFAQFLSFQIQWMIVDAAAMEQYGVSSTDDEITAEADRIYNQLATDGQSREDFLSSNGITEEFLRNIAKQGLLQNQISDMLVQDMPLPSPQEIADQRAAAISSLTSACVSHILVATEAEAQDVMTRLDNGEDFATLAEELSTDTASAANGGALGCASPDTFVESFRDAVLAAPVGEVYDQIVQSNFGYHVILVTQRDEPAEADLPTEDELISTIQDNAALTDLNQWFLDEVAKADVTVKEEYGTWDPSTPRVVPPSS